MRRSITLSSFIAVVAAGAVVLSACGGSGGSSTSSTSGGASSEATGSAPSQSAVASSTAAAGPSGGTLRISSEEPQNLLPSNCYDLYCARVLDAMFTGLYRFVTQPDGTLKPETTELVESISSPDGGTTWDINIKGDWTFTNGEPITAQTFVDTWNYTAYAPNGQQLGFVFGPSQLNVVGYDEVSGEKSTVKEMSGLKVISPTEFQMTLKAPLGESLFANFVGGPQIFPMPSVAFKDIDAFNKQPIGNGQYKMDEPWVPNQKMVIVRNPEYKGKPGNADVVEWRIYNDTNAEWADLQAGNLDLIPQMPQASLATAPQVLGDRFINEPGALQMGYWFFPQQSTTFAKKEVRQAFAMAIDQKAIATKLLNNTQTPATAFAPSTIPGGGTDACGEACVFNPTKAKEMLAAAGGVPGNKVQIAAIQGSPNTVTKAECDMIQKNLGVACSLKLFPDFGALLDAYAKLGPQDAGFIGALGWAADNPTLQNMIGPSFVSDSPSNYIGYNNPEFDKLIAEGNAAQDEATQVAKWQEAQKVLYNDFVAFATTWQNTVAGYSENISNVKINAQWYINTGDIIVKNAG